MAYKTKLQVVTKIERDLDLEEELFIQPDELTEYINDAITIIEAHINTLGLRDQYFLTRTTLSLVSGTQDYTLPANLYEGKIKEVVYSNGPTIYKVLPLTGRHAAEKIAHLNLHQTTDYYQYRIRNDSATQRFFQLIPVSRETASNVIIIEYYRDLARVSLDTDLVEVPDIALQFLYKFVAVKIYEKEGSAMLPQAKEDLASLEKLMIDTLQGQLADDSNQVIEMDKSIYEEMS